MKSPASAGSTAVAETVTVNASGEAGETVAVTVLRPPFSAIESGFSTSVTAGVTAGASSSSVIVSVASAGAVTPSAETVAETASVLSGASSSLSTAVIVTSPVLVVVSAAKLSVAPSRVKSPDDPGSTATAETVTVNASARAGETLAVTRATPPFSPIEPVSAPASPGALPRHPRSRPSVAFRTRPPSTAPPIRMVSSASATPSSSPVTATFAAEASVPVPAGSVTVVDSSR